MNLRLRPEVAEALRAESERTGVSQQEILRRAVDDHLGLAAAARSRRLPDWVEPPRQVFRDVVPRVALPEGITSEQILDDLRAERL